MSYRNQRDHRLLDRKLLADVLITLRDAKVLPSPGAQSRNTKLEELKAACDSELEKAWLDAVADAEAMLPSHAQKLIESCAARPDFLYGEAYTAIWVDGPHHDTSDQQARDAEVDACLHDLGYTSLRFRYDMRDSWLDQMKAHPSVFGPVR